VEDRWPELGEAIRRRRREAKLSQERLAERSKLHWTYISEIENARVNPTISTVRKIADGLGIRTSDLVKDAEESAE
jgi:transcriptional regulator with XRE-family HTH domain